MRHSTGEISFRKAQLGAMIDRVEVSQREIRIVGRKDDGRSGAFDRQTSDARAAAVLPTQQDNQRAAAVEASGASCRGVCGAGCRL